MPFGPSEHFVVFTSTSPHEIMLFFQQIYIPPKMEVIQRVYNLFTNYGYLNGQIWVEITFCTMFSLVFHCICFSCIIVPVHLVQGVKKMPSPWPIYPHLDSLQAIFDITSCWEMWVHSNYQNFKFCLENGLKGDKLVRMGGIFFYTPCILFQPPPFCT